MFKNINYQQLSCLADFVKRDIFQTFNCHQIGIIESFDPGTQRATVKCATKRLINEEPNGSRTWKEYPPFLDVPIFMPGDKTTYLSFPIKQGQECLLCFNDREIDNWNASGGVQPFQSKRMHDFSDAIAFIGLRNQQGLIKDYDNNSVTLSFDDSNYLKINNLGLTHTGLTHLNGSTDITGDLTVSSNVTIGGDLFVGGNVVIDGGEW
jgi:hypothetical protein